MDLPGMLKKEMTEGMVRALLEHAGYRVTDFGIEKLLPALNCLTRAEYGRLGFPWTIRRLPDFVVTSSDEKTMHLVEVKFRKRLELSDLKDLRQQVEVLGELVLVSINASAPDRVGSSLADRHLRCCCLRHGRGRYEISLRSGEDTEPTWLPVAQLRGGQALWAQFSSLHEVFRQLDAGNWSSALGPAVGALVHAYGPDAVAANADR